MGMAKQCGQSNVIDLELGIGSSCVTESCGSSLMEHLCCMHWSSVLQVWKWICWLRFISNFCFWPSMPKQCHACLIIGERRSFQDLSRRQGRVCWLATKHSITATGPNVNVKAKMRLVLLQLPTWHPEFLVFANTSTRCLSMHKWQQGAHSLHDWKQAQSSMFPRKDHCICPRTWQLISQGPSRSWKGGTLR